MHMGTETTTVNCRVGDDLEAAIDEFEAREGHDNRSDAVREMLRVAARETRWPLLYRIKCQVPNYAGLLGLFSMMVLASGWITPAVTPSHAMALAFVLAVMALAMVATVELARLATGQSELGDYLRGVRR